MTKKHFVQLVEIISNNIRYDGYNDYGIRYDNFINELIKVCKETNPLFNEKVFRNAIKLKTLKKVRGIHPPDEKPIFLAYKRDDKLEEE